MASPSNSCLLQTGFYRIFCFKVWRKVWPKDIIHSLKCTESNFNHKNNISNGYVMCHPIPWTAHPNTISHLRSFWIFTWWRLCWFCWFSIKTLPGTELRFKLKGTQLPTKIKQYVIHRIGDAQITSLWACLYRKPGIRPSLFFPAGWCQCWEGASGLRAHTVLSPI